MMTCVWGAVLALLLNVGVLNSLDVERVPHALLLIGSLLAVAVGFPAFRDPTLRNPASLTYLVVGALLLGTVAAAVAFALIMWLLSGWKIGSHN